MADPQPVILTGAIGRKDGFDGVVFSADGRNWVQIPGSSIDKISTTESGYVDEAGRTFDLGHVLLKPGDSKHAENLAAVLSHLSTTGRDVPWPLPPPPRDVGWPTATPRDVPWT